MAFMKDLCEDVRAPLPTSVMTAAISLVLCLITVPGNILIVIAIIKDPYRELSTSFNYFVLQLALSDLIVGIFTEPAFVAWHIHEALDYGVMETIWIIHLTYFISCTASLLSLSALTLDRHLTVVSIRRKLSSCSVARICGMIWLLSLTLPFIYFATGFYLFAFLFANTAVVTTFIIVSFSYCRIYYKLRVQVSRWRSFCQDNVATKAIAMERQVTRAFNLILLFFILCLIPSCVMIYIINLCPGNCDCTLIHWMRDLQFLLTLINCSMNQFLYAWRMPNFRKAVVAILCGKSAVGNRCPIPPSPIRITISCNERGRIETLEFASSRKYMYITEEGDNNENNIIEQAQNTICMTSV